MLLGKYKIIFPRKTRYVWHVKVVIKSFNYVHSETCAPLLLLERTNNRKVKVKNHELCFLLRYPFPSFSLYLSFYLGIDFLPNDISKTMTFYYNVQLFANTPLTVLSSDRPGKKETIFSLCCFCTGILPLLPLSSVIPVHLLPFRWIIFHPFYLLPHHERAQLQFTLDIIHTYTQHRIRD